MALLVFGCAPRAGSGVSSLSAFSGEEGFSGPDEKSMSILRGVVKDGLRKAGAGFMEGV